MAGIGVVVAGAAGRMGRRLVAAVAEDPGLELKGAVEAAGHPELGRDAGTLAGVRELNVKITDALAPLLAGAGVVMDFTSPESTLKNLELCAKSGVAMVIGTTGLGEAHKARAAELARSVAVVLSPNMSVGVNLLFYLTRRAAEILGAGFDIEVVEAHHRLKKDAPSGTALKLAEMAAAGRGWKLSETGRYCREGMIGERPEREIGVQTLRAGDIVGDHTVLLAGPGERIELTHRAHSRDTFAKGAARAAHWVAGRPPGLYDMQDVLGLTGR
ncbi:MAG TPA: 4-hydroxy-tetrahydrodipicolinate reductase [bacterium]|nr:4-hydroxy-tetrahydrodipicolinate reductase [bacterium]